jgi:hypothetical protein
VARQGRATHRLHYLKTSKKVGLGHIPNSKNLDFARRQNHFTLFKIKWLLTGHYFVHDFLLDQVAIDYYLAICPSQIFSGITCLDCTKYHYLHPLVHERVLPSTSHGFPTEQYSGVGIQPTVQGVRLDFLRGSKSGNHWKCHCISFCYKITSRVNYRVFYVKNQYYGLI